MKYIAYNRQRTINKGKKCLWPTLYSSKSLTKSSSAEKSLYFSKGYEDVNYFLDTNFTPEQIEAYEYNPWGVLLTSASKNNLLYTSREFDFETGLQFNRNRYYNPSLGRFVFKDKIFSVNKFVFLENLPFEYKDPFGLSVFHCIYWFFSGGLCSHSNKSECRGCCKDIYKHDLAACKCISNTNPGCVGEAGEAFLRCWQDCNIQY